MAEPAGVAPAGGPAGAGGPLVSVVLPTYDRLGTLPRAVRSVLAQDHPRLELVVVDDGSTDGTRAWLAALAATDPRVRPVLQDHRGATAARNLGVAHSTGAFLAFQDSDDAWEPDFLSSLLRAHRATGAEVVFSSHRLVRLDGTSSTVPARHCPDPARALRSTNVVSTQTALVVADLLRGGAAFDPHLARYQDWDLWLTLLDATGARFVHLDRPLAVVVRSADSISEGSARLRRASLRRILRKHRRALVRDPLALARIVARIAAPAPLLAARSRRARDARAGDGRRR
ncbi:glycosyltransferase family 2 protein [Cellulomonas endophytica]|uniref:glycosyltransferase family 2 protein n=1 Tax=Cellulomonas endophytica TaxID=2494735 RepID=UPI0010125F60|nr:glycosyltransferase family 2 protein [Cellulomonas endophytica]